MVNGLRMFDSIKKAIEDIKKGKMVIVVDDENRENEGDFIMAAEHVTAEAINFMASVGKGLICTPITKEMAKNLDLELMIKENDSLHHTAFTVSIDYKDAGTGISCENRALTIKKMLEPNIDPTDFLRPGHIFPLIARDGGVLERDGHTEAAIDLARLAGCEPAGVICEIMNEDGTMARVPDLIELAKKYDLTFITIDDLKKYLERKEEIIETGVIDFPNKFGNFKLHMYERQNSSEHHIAIVKGKINSNEPTLVRIHSECLTGDVFGSKRCDCGEQLDRSMRLIEENGSGVIIYLRQEGRGIGLPNKIRAYELQDKGLDTIDANIALGFPSDMRTYDFAIEILKSLGVEKVQLMTNNPEKVASLKDANFEVVNRHPMEIPANEINFKYLKTKKDKMNHFFGSIQ